MLVPNLNQQVLCCFFYFVLILNSFFLLFCRMAMLGLCYLAMMQNSVMIPVLTPSKQGNLRDEHNFDGGIFVLKLSHTLSWKMKFGPTSKGSK